MAVREWTTGDVPSLLQLLSVEGFDPEGPTSADCDSAEALREAYPVTDGCCFLVAISADTVVGTAALAAGVFSHLFGCVPATRYLNQHNSPPLHATNLELAQAHKSLAWRREHPFQLPAPPALFAVLPCRKCSVSPIVTRKHRKRSALP